MIPEQTIAVMPMEQTREIDRRAPEKSADAAGAMIGVAQQGIKAVVTIVMRRSRLFFMLQKNHDRRETMIGFTPQTVPMYMGMKRFPERSN